LIEALVELDRLECVDIFVLGRAAAEVAGTKAAALASWSEPVTRTSAYPRRPTRRHTLTIVRQLAAAAAATEEEEEEEEEEAPALVTALCPWKPQPRPRRRPTRRGGAARVSDSSLIRP
jgi:hypothetical protein